MSRTNASSPKQIAIIVVIALLLFFVVKFVFGLLWKLVFYLVVGAVALGVAWFLVDRFLAKK